MGGALDAARDAYGRREWVEARDAYRTALAEEPLSGGDLYAHANAHWWLGELDEALPLLEGAHRAMLAEEQPRMAALVALDTGYTLALRGEEAQASGWMSRAVRLLDGEGDCPERGYLVYCDAEGACSRGELVQALALAEEVLAVGQRHGDRCLLALGALAEGRARVRAGDLGAGMALLDEAMVAAVADDLDPGWAGNIYCNLMLTCCEIGDWQRADEWTSVTARWCETMPGAGPFQGICRVHRAQVLHLRGEWEAAEAEIRLVCEDLARFHEGMVAEATYQLGELCRRRGDLAGADDAFGRAHGLGREPQPGLALLRLDQGHPASAAAMVNRSLEGTTDALARAQLLPAAVDVFLAAGEVGRAVSAAGELEQLAAAFGTDGLVAVAAAARGRVALADDDPATAVHALREAVDAWIRIGARHDAALARLDLGRGLASLGEDDAAALERRVAAAELEELGVAPAPTARVRRADGLTGREAEVLRLVADGRSNRDIAEELVLSVRTVERHLATAYQKLGLSGRSARAGAVKHVLGSGSPT